MMLQPIRISCLTLALVWLPALGTTCEAKEWARKMFSELNHDFGDLAKGADAEHRFQITNLYKEDIQITSVRASCGCTKPRVTKYVLKSGEVSELVTVFDTLKFNGQHQATVTVRFADPYRAEVRLNVRGYVRRDVVFYPGRIEFGAVESEEGARKKVTVSYAGRSDWQIVDVLSGNKNFEVKLNPLNRNGGQISYELFFNLKKGAPPGYIKDQLTLVTNDSRRTTIPLAVEGRVTSSISVSPASLQLGTIKPGDTITKQIVVRGKSPFKIIKVACESGDECFSFEPSDEAKKVHLIPVTYTAAAGRTGKFAEKIQIQAEGAPGDLPTITANVEVVGG